MSPIPSIAAALQAEIAPVYRLYAALAHNLDPVSGMGGRLVWAGELQVDGQRLVRAANIAGAASISTASDLASQKHAIRSGVVDFLVNSLDEALRILKNEIRKASPVAVGVAASSGAIAAEMAERGVLPDLLAPWPVEGADHFKSLGASRIQQEGPPPEPALAGFAAVPAGFEAFVLGQFSEDDHAARRWVRLSPRYLGPALRRIRSIPCDDAKAARIAEWIAIHSAIESRG